jgi:hypothetical protein
MEVKYLNDFKKFLRKFIRASVHSPVANFLTRGRLCCREKWQPAAQDSEVEIQLYSLPAAARKKLFSKTPGLPILVISETNIPNPGRNEARTPRISANGHNQHRPPLKHKANRFPKPLRHARANPRKTTSRTSSSFLESHPLHSMSF